MPRRALTRDDVPQVLLNLNPFYHLASRAEQELLARIARVPVPEPPSLELHEAEQIVRPLFRAHARLAEDYSRALRPARLDPASAETVLLLRGFGTGGAMNDLAPEHWLCRTGVYRSVCRLKAAGLVDVGVGHDARVRWVSLSAAGHAAVPIVAAAFAEAVFPEHLPRGIGPSDLGDALARLAVKT